MSEHSGDSIVGAEGVVKWFDARRGYGFIVGPQNQDIFVHFSNIAHAGFRSLKDGATVTYDAELTAKGWKATRVELVGSIEVRARRRSRSPRR